MYKNKYIPFILTNTRFVGLLATKLAFRFIDEGGSYTLPLLMYMNDKMRG